MNGILEICGYCTEIMKKTVEIEEYVVSALSEDIKAFLDKAVVAHHKSYAPYSEFYVGCAVSLSSGKLVLGSNQENASFPSGLCAERVALFECAQNISQDKVSRIAVYARSTRYAVPKMLVPCAACLQVISDIQVRQQSSIEIWMWDGGDIAFKAQDIKEFLPFHFELKAKSE